MAPKKFLLHQNDNKVSNIYDVVDEVNDDHYIVIRVALNGQIIDSNDVVDEQDVNFTFQLSFQLQIVPLLVDFIACINCLYPIAYKDEIVDVIYTHRYPRLPIAYVLRAYDNSLIISNTSIGDFSEIYWMTQVKCRNCRILLSISSLNMYNSNVDEYINENPCIILDAGSVGFFCKQRI